MRNAGVFQLEAVGLMEEEVRVVSGEKRRDKVRGVE